jgi:hypothetical protein
MHCPVIVLFSYNVTTAALMPDFEARKDMSAPWSLNGSVRQWTVTMHPSQMSHTFSYIMSAIVLFICPLCTSPLETTPAGALLFDDDEEDENKNVT